MIGALPVDHFEVKETVPSVPVVPETEPPELLQFAVTVAPLTGASSEFLDRCGHLASASGSRSGDRPSWLESRRKVTNCMVKFMRVSRQDAC